MIFIKRGNEVKFGTAVMYFDHKPHLYNSRFDKELGEEIEELTEITSDWEVYTM